MIVTKCTGVRCPMQYGYKVDECNHTDCPYRTEPITNADRFRRMTDEEQQTFVRGFWEVEDFADWLKQPCKEERNENYEADI